MKMRADPARSTRQTLPAHITNDGGSLLLSMRSNRIRRIRTPPCAKANPLMMIYYYLALRSLPQRLPQQKAAGTKKIMLIGSHLPPPRAFIVESTGTGIMYRTAC